MKPVKYLWLKLLEVMVLMIGFGLIHFTYIEIEQQDTVVLIHGTLVAMSIILFLLMIGIIFTKEPGRKFFIVLNSFGFLLFCIVGIILINRSDMLTRKKRTSPFLAFYNSRRQKKKKLHPLMNDDEAFLYLMAGIAAIANSFCFLIESILMVKTMNDEGELPSEEA